MMGFLVISRDGAILRGKSGDSPSPDDWVFMPGLPRSLCELRAHKVLVVVENSDESKLRGELEFTKEKLVPAFQEHCPWVTLQIVAIEDRRNLDLSDTPDFIIGGTRADDALAKRVDSTCLHPYFLFGWEHVDIILCEHAENPGEFVRERFPFHVQFPLSKRLCKLINRKDGSLLEAFFNLMKPIALVVDNPRSHVEEIRKLSFRVPLVARTMGVEGESLVRDMEAGGTQFLWCSTTSKESSSE